MGGDKDRRSEQHYDNGKEVWSNLPKVVRFGGKFTRPAGLIVNRRGTAPVAVGGWLFREHADA